MSDGLTHYQQTYAEELAQMKATYLHRKAAFEDGMICEFRDAAWVYPYVWGCKDHAPYFATTTDSMGRLEYVLGVRMIGDEL